MTVNTSIRDFGAVGADFYNTSTTQGFALGTKIFGDNGTTWIYVKVSSTVKQYDCVTIDENYTAASITNANAAKGYQIGWAQQSGGMSGATTAVYGWVAIQGSGIQGRVKGVLNHNSKIYSPATSSGSAGVLRTSAAGRYRILGVVTVTTSSGSSKSTELQAYWPYLSI